jgi:hypothetical protein
MPERPSPILLKCIKVDVLCNHPGVGTRQEDFAFIRLFFSQFSIIRHIDKVDGGFFDIGLGSSESTEVFGQ